MSVHSSSYLLLTFSPVIQSLISSRCSFALPSLKDLPYLRFILIHIAMARNEKTSKSVASKAAKLLSNPKTSKVVKSVAASALAQAPDRKKKK